METDPVLTEGTAAAGITAAVEIAMQMTITRLLAIASLVTGMVAADLTDPYMMDTAKRGASTGMGVHELVVTDMGLVDQQDTRAAAAAAAAIVRGLDHMIDPAKVVVHPTMIAIDAPFPLLSL